MLDTELKQIIEITNKATKAPWTSYREGRYHISGSHFIMTGVDEDRDYDIEMGGVTEEDQDFIAMARNTLPLLTDEILRLQKILDDHSISF